MIPAPKLQSRVIGLWSPAPQCGKSSVAHLLVGEARRGTVVSFASCLKKLVNTFLLSAGVTGDRLTHYSHAGKEEKIPEVGCTYRHLAQTMGTEWGRSCVHPDIWVDLTKVTIRRRLQDGCDLVVIDDMRFPNEAKAIRDLGGELWQVRNPVAEQRASLKVLAHASEGGLATEPFDDLILNDSTWEVLVAKVKRIYAYGPP